MPLYLIRFSTLALALSLLVACSNASEPQPCKRGAINPLLKDYESQLTKYSAQSKDGSSQERCFVDALALNLEILQSGCDTAKLEFHFLPLSTDSIPLPLDAVNAAALAADYLGRTYQILQGPQDFLGLALELDAQAESFEYNEWRKLEKLNCRARVFLVPDPNALLLVLQLEF